MAMRPRVKIAENNANALNSNSQSVINPSSPIYHATLGNKNTYTLLARLGPDAIYAHIMRAAFDPVFGREFSLAHQYENPATRFPLAETTRPHERSENNSLISLLGGSYINPNKTNPFDASIIYSVGNQGKKQEGSYQPYSENYNKNYRKKDDNAPTNKNPLKAKLDPLYKIMSIARAVEQRGREYFKSFYNARIKKGENAKQENNPYENRTGIGPKVAYFGQKLKGYVGKITGYDPQSQVKEQISTYEGQNPHVPTYILPTGYFGANSQQTSLDTNLRRQEVLVPQDVLDATIKDAERFLEDQRRKKRLSLVDNESELELALSK